MKRYHWVASIGGETRAIGYEDDLAKAVEIADSHADAFASDRLQGLWSVVVTDTTQPWMSSNPPRIGWAVVHVRQGVSVGDPAYMKGLENVKQHLAEMHNLVEMREGTLHEEGMIGYVGPLMDAMHIERLHTSAHSQGLVSRWHQH